jgi:hypothetical protein
VICAESQQEEIATPATEVNTLTPWQRRRYCLTSWWDMEQFELGDVHSIIRIFEKIYCTFEHARAPGNPDFSPQEFPLSEQQRLGIAAGLPVSIGHLKRIGLNNSADCLGEFHMEVSAIRQWPFTNKQVVSRIEEFQRTMRREMQSHLFMYIPPDQAELFKNPRADWKEVIERFPATVIDIEECARCFACDRWAAAVFHAVSITEHGVIEFGKLLQLNDPKPGWQSVSREVDKILNRTKYAELSPLHKQHYKLIEQMSPLMLAMNDAWRTKIGHVANRLVLMNGEMNPEIAKDIIQATRAFMRRLASDLPASAAA